MMCMCRKNFQTLYSFLLCIHTDARRKGADIPSRHCMEYFTNLQSRNCEGLETLSIPSYTLRHTIIMQAMCMVVYACFNVDMLLAQQREYKGILLFPVGLRCSTA